MSTFYLVLYIFIAVIVLLCIVSFCMYMMHICGADQERTLNSSKGHHWWVPAAARYAEDEQPLNQSLNQTQVTNMSVDSTGRHEQVELLNVKRNTPETDDPQRNAAGALVHHTYPQSHQQSPERQPKVQFHPQHTHQPPTLPQQQPTNYPPVPSHTAQQRIPPSAYPNSTMPPYHNTAPPGNYPPAQEPAVLETKPVQTVVPRRGPSTGPRPARPLSHQSEKPAIAVKPLVHSLPSSRRHSLVKPDFAPPPPPTAMILDPQQPQVTQSSRASVVKPRAPPPPPPPNTNDEPLPPPPTYNDVIYDKPERGNYLSDY